MTPRTEAGRMLAAFVDAIKPFGSDERVLSPSMVGRIADDIAAIEQEAAEAERARWVAALTSEDEIAHGEAWNENHGHGFGMGVCAYCDDQWPCRTQRGIDRLLAILDPRSDKEPT